MFDPDTDIDFDDVDVIEDPAVDTIADDLLPDDDEEFAAQPSPLGV